MTALRPFPALFLALCALCACENHPRLDVRTFALQHRSGYEAAELIGPYVFRDRSASPGDMSATPEAVTVRETADNLDKIARVLAEFDVPLQGLRLRFQLIEADSFQEPDPAIAHLVDQLGELFRFEGYRLLGEAVVQVAGGDQATHQARQRFLGPEDDFQVDLNFRTERSGSVRLDPIRLWAGDHDVILETSVGVSAGQTLVIGGARARQGGRSYILAVKAETE